MQAKMSEMEEELEKAKAEMTQLREQNSALAGRNAVLEKVLTLQAVRCCTALNSCQCIL